MAPASSYHGGCPTIAEHQEFNPYMQFPKMTSMQQEVIVPNPGCKIAANLWDLNVPMCARAPSPLGSFLRHCNTMDSPYDPTYSKKGATAPADDITDLQRSTALENLRELQKYSEKFNFEATCCRLWSQGIQTQIMDEQDKVQQWIAGMTDDLLRMKRIQPAWTQQMLNPGNQQMQQPAPCVPSQPASSSSASMVPVEPAPLTRNTSMASNPDPWAEARMKQPRK